jgi:Protein of unknown function (DUF3617)
MKTIVVIAMLVFAPAAFAEDPPIPRMFKGMQAQQKGQYRVEVLESDSGRTPQMTICTDNLMNSAEKGRSKGASRGDPSCKHRLLKDTADEATMETVCKDRTTTVNMKREGAKSMLMTISSTGDKRGPHNVKMRYTHLGACREGQGAVTLDANSDECRKIKAQAAQMDPAKQCANAKSDRAACEKQMRELRDKMAGMCG